MLDRRFFSILLSTVLVVALGFPVAALASLGPDDEGPGTAPLMPGAPVAAGASLSAQATQVQVASEANLRDAIASADVVDIDITGDFTLASVVNIPAGKSVSISADNAHTITAGMSSGAMFSVAQGAELNLKGGVTYDGADKCAFVNCRGKLLISGAHLDRGCITASQSAVQISGASASLEFTSGVIENAKGAASGGGAIYVINGASGIMSGGAVKDCTFTGGYTPALAAVSIVDSSFEISGDAVISDNTVYGKFNSCAGGVAVRATESTMEGASLKISGGVITKNKGKKTSGMGPAGGVSVSGGWGPYNRSLATCEISGGVISFNTTEYEGGGICSTGAAVTTMMDGLIAYNEATGDWAFGGGVAADNTFYGFRGGKTSYEAAGTTADEWSETAPGAFYMYGGTIANNKAVNSGGGIYSLSSRVYLYGGKIRDNTASTHGGGIYVSILPFSVNVYDAVITGNEGTRLGGGVWLCPTGDMDIEHTDAAATYANKAGQAGDDFAISHTYSAAGVSRSIISERMLGGGPCNWYYDGTPTSIYTGKGPRFAESKSEYGHNWNGMSSIAFKAQPNDASVALANTKAKLYITGNKAGQGGGIGSNGHLYMGKAESKSIAIAKKWELPEGASIPKSSVSVAVVITGDDGVPYTVEHVALSDENGWKARITDLPHHAKVNIVEDDLPDADSGWVVYYTDTGEIDDSAVLAHENFTVVNAREGKLHLSKEVAGDLSDANHEFHFRIDITDDDGDCFIGRDGEGRSAEFTYQYTGGKAGRIKSGETIALKHGEAVTISGIPHGAHYRVSEVAHDADGYEIEPVRGDGAVGRAAESGTIEGGETTSLAYTNVLDSRMGSLEVSKAVAGNAADPGKEFHFQVRFYHPDGTELVEGEFAYVEDYEGIVASGETFVLRDGESVRIDGIPTGTRWVVKEVVADAHGYEIEPMRGTIRGPEAEEGVVASGQVDHLSYVNEKSSDMGALRVSKQVRGDGADLQREFEFRVIIGDDEATLVDESSAAEFAYVGDREGLVSNGGTIRLRHGESVTIEGLPAGTPFKVQELPAEGYESSAEGAEGVIAPVTTSEASFVNTYEAKATLPPDRVRLARAGDGLTLVGIALLVSASLAAIVAIGASARAIASGRRR